MTQNVTLRTEGLQEIRTVDPMLVSYNVEFAEVTGGTFWKEYTPGQIAGTESFCQESSFPGTSSFYQEQMQVYPPIDLYNEKLRRFTRALGPAWIRVSGTWATKTYYDWVGTTNGKAPDGYLNVLTREQWIGVLDFVRATGTKLMVSVSNCAGLHRAGEPWTPREAEKLFRLSREYGVPILAAEFANEPNLMEQTGFPAGYTAADYRRDQDLFYTWLRGNYPECLAVGPSTIMPDGIDGSTLGPMVQDACSCSDLLEGAVQAPDVFSYHNYNGMSERFEQMMPTLHWNASEAMSEAYLAKAADMAKRYVPLRDRYVPGGQMWVTESGDAGGGGNTWASTYLDVPRTLNELGSFCEVSDGVIFHNTLASSDYGFLQREVFEPRPNYYAVLLWNRLMGTTVYDPGEEIREGAHVYVHSRRDGRPGICALVINNSRTEETIISLPKEAQVYALSGEGGNLRAAIMTCGGTPLVSIGDELPEFSSRSTAGSVIAAPGSCTFFVL